MGLASVVMRLACLLFGAAVGMILPEKRCRELCRPFTPSAGELMTLALGVSKTVVTCAAAAVAAPMPVQVSILYTGMGLLGADCLTRKSGQETWLPIICPWLILYLPFTGVLACLTRKSGQETWLPIICPWLILYLPFTGVLACLGGGLLVLSAGVPCMAGLAMVVLAAPMALLQFEAEGGLVLLLAAAILCAEQVAVVLQDRKKRKMQKNV